MPKVLESIFWKIISCGCFAGINILVRYLAGGSSLELSKPLPIYTIMLWQNLLGVVFLSLYLKKKIDFSKEHLGLHLARVVTAAIGIGLWYLSLRYIPVTQVVALSFIAPIMTTFIAIVLLRESFTWQRGLAISLSMVGAFLLTRPDRALHSLANYNWYLLLPLLAALIFSLDKIFTRQLLVLQASSLVLAWYLLAFIGPICLIPSAIYGWVTPDWSQWQWLVLLGALSACAHYTFNRAYALAEITFLLPFGAAKLLLCTLLSYLVFLEIPNTFELWIGVTIMVLSTLIIGIPSIKWRNRAQVLPT